MCYLIRFFLRGYGSFAERHGYDIYQSAYNGDTLFLRYTILLGRPIDKPSWYDNNTPLHIAASRGHLSYCRILLDNGAMVNRPNEWGKTPLKLAMESSKSTAIIDFLIRRGGQTFVDFGQP